MQVAKIILRELTYTNSTNLINFSNTKVVFYHVHCTKYYLHNTPKKIINWNHLNFNILFQNNRYIKHLNTYYQLKN